MTAGNPTLTVTVPTEQLADDVGTLPDGSSCWCGRWTVPAPREHIDIVVPPYMSMSDVLDRLAGVDVRLVQSQSIGYEGVADLLPDGLRSRTPRRCTRHLRPSWPSL